MKYDEHGPSWSFRIKGGETQWLDEHMEPDCIQVIEFSYDIIAHDTSGEDEEQEEQAGDIHGFVLEYDGKDDLLEAADCHSQTAYDVWELVYGGMQNNEDRGYYSQRFVDAIGGDKGELMCGRVVHIDSVTLLPKFRGHQVGLRAIWGVLNIHEGRLVTLNAHPLQLSQPHDAQFRSEFQLDRFSQDPDESTERLQRYYAVMGFKKIKPIKLDTGNGYGTWMYLDNDYCRPHLYDLVRGRVATDVS